VKTLRTIGSKFRSLGQRPALKREIDEELRFHLEQRTAGREIRGASLGETPLKDLRCRWRRPYPGSTGVPALTQEPDANRPSQQLPEFLDREPGVFDDFSHGESVDRIVAGDHHNARAVAHDRVFAFPQHLETRFLQGANGSLIVDAGQLGHIPSDGDHRAGNFGPKTGRQFGARLKVLTNGVPHIFQSFLAGGALAAAAGKIITPDRESFPGLDQRYRVIHDRSVTGGSHLSSRRSPSGGNRLRLAWRRLRELSGFGLER
jgi:hypothetical protein